MKKNVLSILLAGFLSISSSSVILAEGIDIDSMSLDELKQAYLDLEDKYNALLSENSTDETSVNQDSDFQYTAEGFTYKYLKNEVKNIDGTDYVYVYFEYTNDSGSSSTPYYSLAVKAFQNGVEIQSYMSINEEIPEANVTFKDVKSGTTTNIAIKYALTDESPVSLEVSPMFTYGDTEIGEYTFDLSM